MTSTSPHAEARAESPWRAAVAQWLKAAPGQLDRDGFAQIDVDDLLSAQPAYGVQAALFCMNVAVADGTWRTGPVDGLVVVPLRRRKRMTGSVPRLVDVLSHRWRYGPGRGVPGIYLLTRAAWRRTNQSRSTEST